MLMKAVCNNKQINWAEILANDLNVYVVVYIETFIKFVMKRGYNYIGIFYFSFFFLSQSPDISIYFFDMLS